MYDDSKNTSPVFGFSFDDGRFAFHLLDVS